MDLSCNIVLPKEETDISVDLFQFVHSNGHFLYCFPWTFSFALDHSQYCSLGIARETALNIHASTKRPLAQVAKDNVGAEPSALYSRSLSVLRFKYSSGVHAHPTLPLTTSAHNGAFLEGKEIRVGGPTGAWEEQGKWEPRLCGQGSENHLTRPFLPSHGGQDTGPVFRCSAEVACFCIWKYRRPVSVCVCVKNSANFFDPPEKWYQGKISPEKAQTPLKDIFTSEKVEHHHGCRYPGETLFENEAAFELRRKVYRGTSLLTSVRETRH